MIKIIWNYFKPSWEGEDGKFSYKRASVFVFVWCMVALAFRRIQDPWEFYTFLTFAVLYALQSAIITVAQLIFLLKYKLKRDEETVDNDEPCGDIPMCESAADINPG
ncbi:MAG: hypothetical protein M9898_02295 [Chitinophagaceae bacterium]|nr:hypothetical protein [Chitinophagaceae bacterium]